jgi:hypothetical protein
MMHTKEYIEISFATQTIYDDLYSVKLFMFCFSKDSTETIEDTGKWEAETDMSVIECLLHMYQSDTGLPTLIFVRVGPILSMPCCRTVS